MRIGINGFGRIGRAVLRAVLKHPSNQFEVVHINDLSSPETLSHLLQYDSVHGHLNESISLENGMIEMGSQRMSFSAIKSPAELPWAEKKVDLVFECTGRFQKREDCQLHLKAGAPKVLVSAPAKGEDRTIVYGVNHESLLSTDRIVSNGSCTTNCLAPAAKVLHEHLQILSGLMTTVHSYTNDQRILDVPHSDLRRARAGAVNMIPTSTGAAKAIGLVIPELNGLIDGMAIRVPTPNVSLVDATFQVAKETTVEEVNQLFKQACETSLKEILSCTKAPLVSTDFNGNPHSSIIDLTMTKVMNKKMVKFLAWYDNEMGFSHRMLDVATLMIKP